MITAATIFSVLSKYGSTIWEFFKKYPREVLLVASAIWITVCCMSHCGSSISNRDTQYSKVDTVSVEVDTNWVYPDTAAIFALYGFDTIPDYIEKLENRLRFKAPSVVIADASDCPDSLKAYENALEECAETVAYCDEMYEDAVAVRTYNDKLENDSIRVEVEIKVNGSLYSQPKLKYTYKAPYPIVTKSITTEKTLSPKRQIFLEAGIGARMPWENDRLKDIVGTIGGGFTDKKYNSFGVVGDFTQEDYEVKFSYRKSFNVGK